jgi:hypothetical protein
MFLDLPDPNPSVRGIVCDSPDWRGRLPPKDDLSLNDEYELLGLARRPALHILWKIRNQGHLLNIHM